MADEKETEESQKLARAMRDTFLGGNAGPLVFRWLQDACFMRTAVGPRGAESEYIWADARRGLFLEICSAMKIPEQEMIDKVLDAFEEDYKK